MRKLFSVILFSLYLCFLNPINTYAAVSNLTLCKDSPAFQKRLETSVKKLESRLSKYEEGTPPYISLQKQIEKTKSRFNYYAQSSLLCGKDGLPHLIADGRWSHAREFIVPGILFLYITGWIGWVGRGYLLYSSATNKPTTNEIIIDVPVALKYMASGFLWPLAAWKEYTSDKLLASNKEISVSPR
uniref:Photosystem I reaction center subunit III n=1 Tax=Sciadococcus taiwanensis TaxID=3028030 RepID=A0A9Y1MX05_9RHOD|nr:photosystem I subunit III [Sciadococcus taiwanensis]